MPIALAGFGGRNIIPSATSLTDDKRLAVSTGDRRNLIECST